MSKKSIAGKCALIAATGFVSIALAAPAFAGTTPPAAPQAQQPQGDHKAEQAEHFNEHKQKLLKKIGEHIAEMQKRQSCVQAATDHQAMWACFPHDNKGGGEGKLDEHVEDHGSAQPPSGQQPTAKH